MRVTEAIAIIEDLVFRPGWTLEARPAYVLDGDGFRVSRSWNKIEVSVTIETVDTNQQYAAGGYRKPKTILDEFEVDVSLLDRDGLEYELLKGFAATHSHEDREFLRSRSNGYEARFHPHRTEGNRRWDAVRGGDRLAALEAVLTS
jgi:hypothetical protein